MMLMLKIVNAALKAKASTFEAKAGGTLTACLASRL